MNYFTVAIYVLIDDILKAANHREDKQRVVNDAMILTTMLVSCRYFGGNIEKGRTYMRDYHCPEMLSKSQFNRRMHNISDLTQEVFGFFAEIFKAENTKANYLLDSFPVAVCHNIRISRSNLLESEMFRGKSASKRVYFYGFKVAVLTTEDGFPIEIAFIPGSYFDTNFLNNMYLNIQEGASIFCDSGFQNYEVEDVAKELDHCNWETCRKKNTQRGDIYGISLWKKSKRRLIESVFSVITGNFPKSIHAVTINGFLIKCYLFIFAYGVEKWLA